MEHLFTTAGFIVLGMTDHNNTGHAGTYRRAVQLVDQVRGMGVFELVSCATGWAQYACDLALVGAAMTGEYPGVFDYEVSEVFGAWYASQVVQDGGNLPRNQACANELKRLALSFFLEDLSVDQAKHLERAFNHIPIVVQEL